jgi:intracellular multiplication protein IcmE
MPTPRPESARTARVAAVVDPKVEAAYTKQIDDLFSQWGGRAPRTEMVLPTTRRPGDGAAGNGLDPVSSSGHTRGGATPKVAPAHDDAVPRVLIPAGRGVYAHPVLALSSDQSSPVVLQADSGPIAGDRMIGGFARENDRLVIHVDSIVHDGETLGADGVVIAPDTMEASVATGVDQHYLARFILPAAAAFVRGLGQALATTSNTTAVLSPLGGATTTTHLNFDQQLGVGAGVAAAQVGSVLNQVAPKGPTVTLEANVAVGVMFLSPVTSHHGG